MNTFRTRRRRGGPRTPTGKTRSRRNAATHNIFSSELLPAEVPSAVNLSEEIQQYFSLNDRVEKLIGEDLTRNLIEKERIEKWAEQEGSKAYFDREIQIRQSGDNGGILNSAPKNAPEGFKRPFRPAFCVIHLEHLKKTTEEGGLDPRVAVECIDAIYGSNPTSIATTFRYLFGLDVAKKGGNDRSPEQREETKKLILISIEEEIKFQNELVAIESAQRSIEESPNYVAMPSAEVLDRIERYRTSNARARRRILDDLKLIRTLKVVHAPKEAAGERASMSLDAR